METKFETIHCPICGSNEYDGWLKVPDRYNLKSGNKYQIVTCRSCKFVYLNPAPKVEFISEIYPNGAYQPFLSTQETLSWWDKIYRWVRAYSLHWKRGKIEKLISSGKLLDVGCGTGEFLHQMKKHGWEVEGIEIDTKASEFANKEYGVKVLSTNLNDLKLLENSFEIITMWHVLEHLYKPLDNLIYIKNKLNEDGILVVAVPNISSFDARFYRDKWIALDAPRHLQHFEPNSFISLCEAAQLEVFKCQQMPIDAFYNCLMSELLIISLKPKQKILLPLFLLRAFVIALISLIKGSHFRNDKISCGSSNLYFIHPKKSSG